MKKKITIFALSAVLCLCSCNNTTAVTENNETTTVSETTTTASQTTTTVSGATTKASETTTTTAATTTTTAVTTAETAPPVDYSNFSLLDYYGDFDEAEPMRYTMVDGGDIEEDTDKNRYDIAVNAVINSDYYAELMEETKTLFTYENGEIIPTSESWMNWGYENCLSYDENDGFIVTPILRENILLDFDLQNKETLFVFRLPIISRQIEWSGTSIFFLPVYVNSENEAYILHEAVAQSLHTLSFIKFEDGYHVLFDRGHTTGTSQAHIYSFENGRPKLEYHGTYINYHSEGIFFTNDHSGGSGSARVGFFRDKIRGCYCGVEALPLEGEAAKIIRNSEMVKEEFGFSDMHQYYVVGGNYVMIPMADCFSFENGELIDADIGINCPPHEDDFDIVLNIDFSKYQ